MSLCCLLLATLLGCPEEPPDMASQLQAPGGAPGQAPGDAGAQPPPDGAPSGEPGPPGDGQAEGEPGPPGDGAPSEGGDASGEPSAEGGTPGAMPADGAEGSAPGGAPPPGELPSFELGDTTITISGTVAGADKGQVDFLVIEEEDGVKRPRVLHVAQLEAGAFEVTAPATWEDPIYVSTLVDETGDGPDPTDPEGGLEAPITLAGTDLTLELTLEHVPTWLEALHADAEQLEATE